MCRSASGARSTTRRTASSGNASSTRWRMPPAGSLPVPPQAAAQAAEAPRRARRGGEEGRLGHAAAAGRLPRHRASIEAYGSSARKWSRSRSSTASVRVHRVVAALDCGHVVNPLSIEMQVEGGVVYALTAALYGEITIKDGGVEQANFDDYEMLRIADAPQVETVHGAERRFLGRRRRAAGAAAGAGVVQRDLRRDRQAHSRAAAEEPRSGLSEREADDRRRGASCRSGDPSSLADG